MAVFLSFQLIKRAVPNYFTNSTSTFHHLLRSRPGVRSFTTNTQSKSQKFFLLIVKLVILILLEYLFLSYLVSKKIKAEKVTIDHYFKKSITVLVTYSLHIIFSVCCKRQPKRIEICGLAHCSFQNFIATKQTNTLQIGYDLTT